MVATTQGMAMARDAASALIIDIYEATRGFPADETFGLTLRFRKAAIDVAALISKDTSEVTAFTFIQNIERCLDRLDHLAEHIAESRDRGLLSNPLVVGLNSRCATIKLCLDAAMAGLIN